MLRNRSSFKWETYNAVGWFGPDIGKNSKNRTFVKKIRPGIFNRIEKKMSFSKFGWFLRFTVVQVVLAIAFLRLPINILLCL
jgi:hypothetical protein